MQLDLFVKGTRPVDLNGADRQKAVALLQALLTEAATKPTHEQSTNGKKEVGNE
jgi:hypothetical protein